MNCIFCLQEKPPSEEHVFPEAIGGTLVIDRFCKDCNSDLGTRADSALSNHPLIAIARSQLNLPGKRGGVPDPFRDVFRIGTLVDDPDQRVRLSQPTGLGDRLDVALLYKRTETTLPDGSKAVQIVVDARDIDKVRTIIQRERSRAGVAPLTDEELDKALQQVTRGAIEQPWIHHRIPIDIVEYHRG